MLSMKATTELKQATAKLLEAERDEDPYKTETNEDEKSH